MTIMQLNTYLNKTVRIEYTTKTGPQSRVGFVYTISTRKIILLAFPGDSKHSLPYTEEEEFELYIQMKSITNIKELKGAY